MTKLQAIIEVIFYFTALFMVALARVIFEKKRLWNVSLDFKNIPRKRVDKQKFAKLMSRLTK